MSKFVIDKHAHVLIATFSPWKNGVRLPINGNLEPMRDYFMTRVEKLVLIDQVYPGSDMVLPRIEVYEQGKLKALHTSTWMMRMMYPLLRMTNNAGTQVSFKIRDFFSVLIEGINSPKPFDIYIGFEAINALSGVILRMLGKVKTVIYYVSDYSPNRYESGWFNRLYLWLDRQAAMQADVVWDVSRAMMPARIHAGLDEANAAPVLCVPNALYPAQIKALPVSKVIKNTLVFLGTLGFENGPDIAVRATAIVSKKYPDVRLHIIGGNEPNERKLQILAKDLGIQKHVIFHGFIADREKVSKLARMFQIALAPYKNIEGSARKYGDATKIRAYTAAGLPVITTSVPPLGKDIQIAGAGLLVHDTPEAFASAIIKLLTDQSAYMSMREASIRFAHSNTWVHEYDKAFLQMKRLSII